MDKPTLNNEKFIKETKEKLQKASCNITRILYNIKTMDDLSERVENLPIEFQLKAIELIELYFDDIISKILQYKHETNN